MLETLGVWSGEWPLPACGPVEYLSRLGYLRQGTLVVHGVHLTDPELDHLRRAGAVLVTCPRSNEWVGGGPPRLAHFYASGVPVAIGRMSPGADAQSSDELAEMRRTPEVSAAALPRQRDAASSALVRRPWHAGGYKGASSVKVPAATRDVEEYLVSGVPAADVRRVA
jgi:cytosine/adenosine deaminase-related metal-dependent hydrolase